MHTIPKERYAFLYALVTDTPMSFPYLFFRSFIEVHRSSSSTHALFFPVFIHRILLHLGLDEFSTSEPVHIIAPIGATFLRQRATQMRAALNALGLSHLLVSHLFLLLLPFLQVI